MKGSSSYTNLRKADWTIFITESEQTISCQLALKPLWLVAIVMKLFAGDGEVIEASNEATLRTWSWSLCIAVYLRIMPVWKWCWVWLLGCSRWGCCCSKGVVGWGWWWSLVLIWKKWPKVCDEGGRLGWWEVEVGSGHRPKGKRMRIRRAKGWNLASYKQRPGIKVAGLVQARGEGCFIFWFTNFRPSCSIQPQVSLFFSHVDGWAPGVHRSYLCTSSSLRARE